MSARQFTLISLFVRIGWAGLTLSLTGILPIEAYGEFSFLQIAGGMCAQIVFGVFANIVTGKIAAAASQDQAESILSVSTVYTALVAFVCFLFLCLLGVLNLANFTPFSAFVAATWMYATYVIVVSTGVYISRKQYFRATAQVFAQLVLYAVLLYTLASHSGSGASLAAAASQLLPCLGLLVWDRILRAKYVLENLAMLRQTFADHMRATCINVSYLPNLVLLWILTTAIATHAGTASFAKYGLGNQFSALFLFLPTAISSVMITRFAREQNQGAKDRLVAAISIGFTVLGLIGGAVLYFGIELFGHLLPAIFATAKLEIAIAIAMAGFVAARSPFAWLNQIESRSISEIIAALASAVILLIPFVMQSFDALDVMSVRAGSTFVVLILSIAMYIHSNRKVGRPAK